MAQSRLISVRVGSIPGAPKSANPTEQIGMLDAIVRRVAAQRAQIDAIGLTDHASIYRAATLLQQDPVGIAESVLRAVGGRRIQTDAQGITDHLVGMLTSGGNNWLADPVAHGRPWSTNTGPSGILTDQSGNVTLGAGAVLADRNLTGKITLVGSSGVAPQILNVRANSTTNICLDASGWTGSNRPQIHASEFNLNNGEAACCVKPGNAEFFNVNAHGGQDVVDTGAAEGFFFYDSFLHGCQRNAALTSHNDTFQALSGAFNFIRCTMLTFFDYSNTSDDFNSVLQTGQQSGDIGPSQITDCLWDGGHFAENHNWSSTDPNFDSTKTNSFRGPHLFGPLTISGLRIGRVGDFRPPAGQQAGSGLDWKTNSTPPAGTTLTRSNNVWDDTGAAAL